MMYRIVVIYFLGSLLLSAQQIKVLDCDTQQPIPNLMLSDETGMKGVYTDAKGVVDISEFYVDEVIYFDHISYIEAAFIKDEIGIKIFLCKKAEQFKELVLSVSKKKEDRSHIAESVNVVSEKQIRKKSPQTSADLLATVPGVKVQKSQMGGGSPIIRGMEANRVLLVVDGVRMNNAIYRMGHIHNSITVSPNILERMEVVFGPSSVIYGSDALGGVVHYYTKNLSLSPIFKLNGEFYTRYSSVNNEFTNSLNISLKNRKWATFTSFSHSKFGDLKMGKYRQHGFSNWGAVRQYSNNTDHHYNDTSLENNNINIQKNTHYSQTDFLQKVKIPISKETELLLNLQYSTSSDIPRFDKLTEYKGEELKFAEWYYGPQQRWMISSQLQLQPDKRWLQKGTITAAYQNVKESRIQRKMGDKKRFYRKENVDVLSINGDFFVPFDTSENRLFSYGFEGAYNRVTSNAEGKLLKVQGNTIVGFDQNEAFNVATRYPDGGSYCYHGAFYVNYKQNFSPKLTLNSGIRYSYANLRAKWHDESFIKLPKKMISINNTAFNYTFGGIYRPAKNWQFNVVASSGFRSPNIDDIGKVREKKGKVTIPNPFLRPEYAHNFELNIMKYSNQHRFKFTMAAYYTMLKNYIARDYVLSDNGNKEKIIYDGQEVYAMSNFNKGTAFIYGGTAGFKGKIAKHIVAKSFLTYTYGKTNDTHQPLSSIPPLYGSVEIGYTSNVFDITAYWKFNARKKIADTNLVEGIDNVDQTPYLKTSNSYYGTPAWNTFNINSEYKAFKNVNFYLSLENILDVHYKEFASGISAGGFNISIASKINF